MYLLGGHDHIVGLEAVYEDPENVYLILVRGRKS